MARRCEHQDVDIPSLILIPRHLYIYLLLSFANNKYRAMVDMVPTFGWMCTDSSLLPIVGALLDVQYAETNGYRIGRIGCLNVAVNNLPEKSCAADAAHMAQIMATTFNNIEAILITG